MEAVEVILMADQYQTYKDSYCGFAGVSSHNPWGEVINLSLCGRTV